MHTHHTAATRLHARRRLAHTHTRISSKVVDFVSGKPNIYSLVSGKPNIYSLVSGKPNIHSFVSGELVYIVSGEPIHTTGVTMAAHFEGEVLYMF